MNDKEVSIEFFHVAMKGRKRVVIKTTRTVNKEKGVIVEKKERVKITKEIAEELKEMAELTPDVRTFEKQRVKFIEENTKRGVIL